MPAGHPHSMPRNSGHSMPRTSGQGRVRYRRLILFFGRLFLSALFWDGFLRALGFRALARRTATRRYTLFARRFRALAVRMGGVLIKVGQFLSARVDILPEYVTAELSGLQDEVPPEEFSAIRRLLESELQGRLSERFASFEELPLAAASLGQAHRAQLPSGERVVVKVQRPNIQALVETDLRALRTIASWLKRYRPIARRADVEALLSEFSRVLREELDYEAEAANAVRFAEMFAGEPGLHVPAVYPSHTTRRVLTLEDVYFIKITDYDAITAAGIDRADVADRLFKTYLQQIFVEGWFHADPHPGNLFIEPLPSLEGRGYPLGPPSGDPDTPTSLGANSRDERSGQAVGAGEPGVRWRLAFVDFGMVGSLTAETKAGLREAAIAVGTRDPARLVGAYVRLNVLLPSADLKRVEQAETAVFDAFWGKTMWELRAMDAQEYRRLARQFRDLLHDLPFQIPKDLIFLGRCVAILSGMCTGLSPQFNLFEGLAPFAVQLLREERGGALDAWLDQLLEFARVLLSLPSRLDRALARLERGELELPATADPELLHRLDRLARSVDRLGAGLVLGLVLGVSFLAYQAGQTAVGVAGLALAVLLGLWLVWSMWGN